MSENGFHNFSCIRLLWDETYFRHAAYCWNKLNWSKYCKVKITLMSGHIQVHIKLRLYNILMFEKASVQCAAFYLLGAKFSACCHADHEWKLCLHEVSFLRVRIKLLLTHSPHHHLQGLKLLLKSNMLKYTCC